MGTAPERACLAIADVSGYTGYLAGVELDHAQDILADLISTVVEAMVPFELYKLEGDAAFSFMPGDTIDGSSLQDTIEGTYIAFRTRLRDIKQASTCECNACIRIPALDLKFVVHHGPIARQSMLGREELVGPEVILVHRLLKNSVRETTGIGAYALYSQACLEAAGVDPRRQRLVEHHEETDVGGEVVVWIRDLEARWQAELDRPRLVIPPQDRWREYAWEAPVEPGIVFDYLTSPARRPTWDRTITEFRQQTDSGRRGLGTTNHCMHGKDLITEQILDWRPPHYWLIRSGASFVAGDATVLMSDELEPLPGGRTRVVSAVGPDRERDRSRFEAIWPVVEEGWREAMANLLAIFEEMAAERAATDHVAAPVSGGRHLAEPIEGRSER